ncbi:MAG: copper amine oxidase N-terminal domain-containing protein [Clostridiales bacterium]|nr:copper amine oxidase N-terminal domain-containing protein [Clostridiales bacterium]
MPASLIACALGLLFSFAIPVGADTPGSAADPLITQEWLEDYVQKSFAPLKQRLDQLEQQLGGGLNIVLTIGNAHALVNGKTVSIPAPPQIMGAGYTMVPARFVGEALGLNVAWDAAARKVIFSGQGQSVSLTIGRTTATINGRPYAMPMAPLIAGEYTLVHIRFISEAFNCKVDWDQTTRSVTITK